MRRGVFLLVLLLSLLWQSVAVAGGRLLPELAEDAEHAALHWEDQAHHHHDDGSYEAHDDDDGAAAHIHLDGAAGGAALPGASPCDLGTVEAGTPVFFYLLTLPSPPPSGLRRPPRSLS